MGAFVDKAKHSLRNLMICEEVLQHDDPYKAFSEALQYRPVTTPHTRVNFRMVAMRISNHGPSEVKAVVHDHE